MKRLLFVSPRFLFPVDSGGKIRTTQILRGLKAANYEISLLSPATQGDVDRHRADLESVCADFRWWPSNGVPSALAKARHVFDALPIPIRTDVSAAGADLVATALEDRPDAVVFDFLHACALLPERLSVPSVLFTHNVESQIFSRHLDVATDPLRRSLWRSQFAKMQRFEARSVPRFDVVVAVSPTDDRRVVFVGSMDWLANQDGVRFFMDEVWSRIVDAVPDARMSVVGRSPPSSLVRRAEARGLSWTFTGFVDDVRPYVTGAAVSVVPLRIGGGTRLKVYEAMAMGCPIVSTTIGVEGLSVVDREHYLCADAAEAFADCVVQLIRDADLRTRISRSARELVDAHFGIEAAARAFAVACETAIEAHRRSI